MNLMIGIIALVAGGVLLLLPGYALIIALRPRWGFDSVETLCAAAGLSIAVVPLILYATSLLGFKLAPWAVVLLLAAMAAVCLWDGQRRLGQWRRQGERSIDPIYLLLGIIFALTLLARLWTVQGIEFPLWTDSYHHTVVAQLIADRGTIPSSYTPYAPIDRFTYHFGFHTLAAWFHWLGGLPVPRSVVLVGQLVNALVVPTTYLFASRLCHSRLAGLVAALTVGLVSHMPAMYVNWGRYPQLTGQILMAALIPVSMEALDSTEQPARGWLLAGIAAAGLYLVHIRVFLFYVLFLGLWFLFKLLCAWRGRETPQIKRLVVGALVTGGSALILIMPWLLRFFRGFGGMVAQELAGGYQVERYDSYFRWRVQDLIEFGLPLGLLILATSGGFLGILRKNRNILLLTLWMLALFAAANTHLIGITPLFSNLVASISLYLPLSALVGYLVDQLVGAAIHFYGGRPLVLRLIHWGTATCLILIGLAGVPYTARLIKPSLSFVRPADLEAMEWIEQNIPQDALFHIGTHFWTPVVAHGLDAGYWMPFLAHRQTTIPVQLYSSDGSPQYRQFINSRARDLLEVETSEKLWEMMREYDITHVYLGARPANLRPEFFLDDPVHFEPLYSKDGVWVFETVH